MKTVLFVCALVVSGASFASEEQAQIMGNQAYTQLVNPDINSAMNPCNIFSPTRPSCN